MKNNNTKTKGLIMKRQDYDHSKLEGTDADIETSLKEYGLAWIETDSEFLFYHGIKAEANEYGDMDYIKFDFYSFNKDMNLLTEFDWIEWDSVYSFVGLSDIEFHDTPLPHKIYDLVSYYGSENIFGSSYWEGLDYTDIITEEI